MKWNLFKNNSNPTNQYSKQYKDEVLNAIIKKNDITKMPIAFSFLLTSSDDLKIRTVEALHLCLSKLKNKELILLDALFRERTFIDWTYDWKIESPNNLYLSNVTDNEKVSVLGLCTFHPNGYLREDALKILSSFETGRVIPFFLLRCNDWVSEVRNTARHIVEERISIKYVEQIVKNLPIVFKLRNSNRVDHSVLFDKIVKLLSQQEAVPFLHQATESNDNKIRYFSYKVMIYSNNFRKNTLFDYFKREKDPHSRLILFNEFMSGISETELNEYYQILKKDKFPKIRAEALQKYYTLNPNQNKEELEEALFDKSGAIRWIARYLLKKQNITDFDSYYTKVIKNKNNEKLRGALLGIGEVGNEDHVKMVLPLLKSEKVGIVKASIRAISMLDAINNKDVFIKMLSHEQNGISKEARKALQATFYNDKVDEIYQVYKEGYTSHSKYNAAVLLSSLSKWESIQYIIEFYVNKEDDSISKFGNFQIVKWIATFNRTFNAPSKEQVSSIRRALIRYGSEIRESDRKQIEFCLKLY